MTKRKTTLSPGKRRERARDDESLLLRSAESLGRVIGALQRELDKAHRWPDGDGAEHGVGDAAPAARPKNARKKTKTRHAATAPRHARPPRTTAGAHGRNNGKGRGR